MLSRQYRGQVIEVRILADGVSYEGRRFRSLSGVAEYVTGTRWNGHLFFRCAGAQEERQ